MRRKSRALRVLFVIGSAARGGAEGQLVGLACELAAVGTDVRVAFLTAGGPLTTDLDFGGVSWEVLRPKLSIQTSTGDSIVVLARLARRLIAYRPTVVFAWLPGAIWMSLPLTAILTRARRIAGVRGTISEHALFKPILRHAIRRAHAVTINAPHLRADAIQWGANSDRIVFIPNGVAVPAAMANVDLSPPVAVVLANFRRYKGHDVLVDALALMDEPVRVRLLGEGLDLEPTRKKAIELEVIDQIEFINHPADVPYELARAQFAIHPSRTEGLSNAILEELATGLPVIAGDVGGNSLLIDDGVQGFIVPDGSTPILAERISELAASPELRAEMGAAARKRAAEFGWDVCVNSYLRLFADICQPKRKSH